MTNDNSKLPLPLKGVRVLDATHIVAGPFSSLILADMGAEVIKIERPGTGDLSRGRGPFLQGEDGQEISSRYLGINRNKKSVSLDLRNPLCKKAFENLIRESDVLIDNWGPGAFQRLGLGYEQLKEINPGLVYVYAGGYGPTGPHSQRPSMHPIPGAVCGGVMTQMGEGGVPPADQELTIEEIQDVSRRWGRANEGNPDPSSSMAVSTAALLGFYAKKRTGKGQYITSSMLQANAYANADDFFWYEGKPSRPMPDVDGYGLHALYRLYKADMGWVFLACPLEEEWNALCETVERQDLLKDPRFSTPEARKENDAALADELGKMFATKKPLDWEQLLSAADVTCVRAEDSGPYQFSIVDEHVKENEYLTEVISPRFGDFMRYSPAVRFSHTSPKVGVGCLRGQHNEAILQEIGYSQEQIVDLAERGVTSQEEI